MRVRRYQHRPAVPGHDVVLQVEASVGGTRYQLLLDGRPAASASAGLNDPDPLGVRCLQLLLPDGRALRVEAGYNSWTGTGARAFVDGALLWESHPGRLLAPPAAVRRLNNPQRSAAARASLAQMRRNWPAMACDAGIGLLFYAVASVADLPTAAIVSALAGLALAVVQRFVTVDLLGGLARFGIVMGLVSAGLAIAFRDDRAVMMRSTVLGAISALAFLGDAALGGRWLGRGMATYMPTPMQPRRLALGMGLLGLAMAGSEQGVIWRGGSDLWLTYTTFIETPVTILIAMLVMRWARA
ncbi:MAG: septation protein IspZ [Sphingomonadales bacterium]|jgi:intracellular septation protein A